MIENFKIQGKVELFPQKGGWYFVRVPFEISAMLKEYAARGLIAIKSKVGQTEWNTSLLPMGDNTHFIALSAKVRKKESIKLNDIVKINFSLR